LILTVSTVSSHSGFTRGVHMQPCPGVPAQIRNGAALSAACCPRPATEPCGCVFGGAA